MEVVKQLYFNLTDQSDFLLVTLTSPQTKKLTLLKSASMPRL